MLRARREGCSDGGKATPGYAETDPSGRYGRFREVLGKGAMKTVYKAFDQVMGMEVAWSQVKLHDLFHSPVELQRLYSEVHLLKNLDHESIMKFCASWIDPDRRTFNFITELFTSGTLRQYRQKYPQVSIRAVKNWARQILKGLTYLHSHDPPVIHRDLKCDNIFVNGHLGQIKIGDLGLAAILQGSQHAHSVIGTPEFMAPELYEEEYDELVDIYSFGMCMLEMLTAEYPYGECSNPAQIYKKVTSGKLPEAFYRIQDVDAREFVSKCLQTASKRLPAKELLLDPFVSSDLDGETMPNVPKVPSQNPVSPNRETMGANVPLIVADHVRNTNMMIKGTMDSEEDTIFLKVQISEKDGQARNIYFPFDIVNDTSMDVAVEMVKELEITDWDPTEIALMIEAEIISLVPTWKNRSLTRTYDRQDSFNCEEEDDDDEDRGGTHHPFYTSSSVSSSQASLRTLLCPPHSLNPTLSRTGNISSQNWLEDVALINDDTTSLSSINSFKYSSFNYSSANEMEDHELLSPKKMEHAHCNLRSQQINTTRFCPELNRKETCFGESCSNPKQGMNRIRSMVDVRSQLLHKSLVEEINRRRLFKTVGAVQDIGFQEPC